MPEPVSRQPTPQPCAETSHRMSCILLDLRRPYSSSSSPPSSPPSPSSSPSSSPPSSPLQDWSPCEATPDVVLIADPEQPVRRLRDEARAYVRAMLTAYGGMLNATYVVRERGTDEIPIVRPAQSHAFVMERLLMSVKIIFFESVRRTLLTALEKGNEKLHKTVRVIVGLLIIAENEPHVKMRLLSAETELLINLSAERELEMAEPPCMQTVAEVPWHVNVVHGLIEPSALSLFEKLFSRNFELCQQFFNPPEGPRS